MSDQAMTRIAGRFGRAEPRATARAHLLGLLSSVERKNCWQPAEQAGHARPRPMQRLLRYARRDADARRDDVRTYADENLGTDGGVLIVDETGFVKKGRASAGVRRQCTGPAGHIENSQAGVFLALRHPAGTASDRPSALPSRAFLVLRSRAPPRNASAQRLRAKWSQASEHNGSATCAATVSHKWCVQASHISSTGLAGEANASAQTRAPSPGFAGGAPDVLRARPRSRDNARTTHTRVSIHRIATATVAAMASPASTSSSVCVHPMRGVCGVGRLEA